MNNLKRVLSLGLSGALMASLMITGASAVDAKDFTDADKIQNKEAVTTMVALGVINGKEDGSNFDPEGTVTRAEMAKMIAIMLCGGNEPAASSDGAPVYADVSTTYWAKKYIEFCSSKDNTIINGTGDGNYMPESPVTGSAAAKMALGALGYDPSIFGFTGIDWAINVNAKANAAEADLYNGLSGLDTSAPLTRDQAARLLYNALNAKMMSKGYETTVSSDGSLKYQYSLSNVTMIEKKFNAVKVEGVVTANEVSTLSATASHLDADRTRIAITNYGDGSAEQNGFSGDITIKAATDIDDLGRAVSIYVKKDASKTKADILGTVISSQDNVTYTDYSADSIADVADDKNVDLTSDTVYVTNYGSASNTDSTTVGRGVEKILIDNDDDGKVDYVLVNTYRFGKVTTYVTSGDGAITVTTDTSANSMSKSNKADVTGFEDVAKDDYVLAAEIGGRIHVSKAETVNGALKSYKNDGNTKVATKLTVDDTAYNVSWVGGYTGGTDNIRSLTSIDYGKLSIDTEATYYLGRGDYLVAAGDVVDQAYNYALVLAVGTTGLEERIRVMLSDGTAGTYDVASNSKVVASNPGSNTIQAQVGEVYAYSFDSNKAIKLSVPAYTNSASSSFSKGKTTVASGVYANSSTPFFYVGVDSKPINNTNSISSGDVNVYTGYSSAPDVTGATGYYYKSSTTGNTATAVVYYGQDITSVDVSSNLYIYDVQGTGSDYSTVKAFVNGSATAVEDLKVDGDDMADKTAYLYTVNSDGQYVLKDVPSSNLYTNKTVKNAGSKSFVLSNDVELKVTGDTLVVDNSKYLDAPAASLGTVPQVNDKITYAVFNKDDEAVLVVIRNEKKITQQDDTDTLYATFDGATVVINSYTGTLPTVPTMIDLIKSISKVTDVAYTNGKFDITMDGIKYTGIAVPALVDIEQLYKVSYNGSTQYLPVAATSKITVADQTGETKLIRVDTLTATGTDVATYDEVGTAPAVTNGKTEYTVAAADITTGTKDITLVDGYKFATTGSVAALKAPVTAGATISGDTYIPAGTVLTVKASSTKTATATFNGRTVNVTASTAGVDYEMPAYDTSFTEIATPAPAVMTIDDDGTSSAGSYAANGSSTFNGTFTDKAGNTYTVTVSPEFTMSGKAATVTITPTKNVVASFEVTVNLGTAETIGWTGSKEARTIDFTSIAASTIVIKDVTVTP